jgi:hypothetical protein
MYQSESIKAIAQALVKAQMSMSDAKKSASNPFFKSKYADINSVREACIPALNENGICAMQPTVTIEGKPYVKTILLHESGEWIAGYTEIICGKQNDAQSHGSGLTYARRYGLQSMTNLGSEDDDGNAAQSNSELPWINDSQVQKMIIRIKAGEQGIIDQAKAAFRISKLNMDKLINAK